jgi:hypothetical protein
MSSLSALLPLAMACCSCPLKLTVSTSDYYRGRPSADGFGIPDQFPHRDPEACADAFDRRRSEILPTALKHSVVRPTHPDVVREILLAVFRVFSPLAYSFPDAFLDRAFLHGRSR